MSDTYLFSVINKYAPNSTGVQVVVTAVVPVIQAWAGDKLIEMIYAGSVAKGTAISLSSDADIFVSLSSTTQETLEAIYESLYLRLASIFVVTKQNVAVTITSGGVEVDIVPGRRQSQYGNDHSLFKSKSDSWVKTNVRAHINYVMDSGRANEIKLVKIWRTLRGLAFPSFYIELAVIGCLYGVPKTTLSANFLKVLQFLASEFSSSVYVDPANTNNVISNDLSASEKYAIKTAANNSLSQSQWNMVVW